MSAPTDTRPALPRAAPDWSAILVDAVSKPGMIHQAYSRFWNYSVGNQLLALFECMLRGLEPGPINTFLRWIDLGRHVKKGENGTPLPGLSFVKSYSATGLSVTANPLFMADANYDGMVNASDLGRMALSWQSSGTWINGDFNNDHFVDVLDLAILANNWQTGVNAPSFIEGSEGLGLPGSSVLEPAGLGVLGLAAILLKRSRRQR